MLTYCVTLEFVHIYGDVIYFLSFLAYAWQSQLLSRGDFFCHFIAYRSNWTRFLRSRSKNSKLFYPLPDAWQQRMWFGSMDIHWQHIYVLSFDSKYLEISWAHRMTNLRNETTATIRLIWISDDSFGVGCTWKWCQNVHLNNYDLAHLNDPQYFETKVWWHL